MPCSTLIISLMNLKWYPIIGWVVYLFYRLKFSNSIVTFHGGHKNMACHFCGIRHQYLVLNLVSNVNWIKKLRTRRKHWHLNFEHFDWKLTHYRSPVRETTINRMTMEIEIDYFRVIESMDRKQHCFRNSLNLQIE